MLLFSRLRVLYTLRRCPVVIVSYGPAPLLRQLGLDREQTFLLERRERHGVPSPRGQSCMVCDTVCLTVMSPFSDITDVLTIGHSFKTERSRTPLFHVAQYGDDITGREFNLRKLPGRQWESNR